MILSRSGIDTLSGVKKSSDMANPLYEFNYTITVAMSERRLDKFVELMKVAGIGSRRINHRDTVEFLHMEEDASDVELLALMADRR
jgi:hypothetical protein